MTKNKAKEIIAELKILFPKKQAMLNYSNNWELLVAVILSARCTDKKVNEITSVLFKKYKTLDDYICVANREFEKDIKQSGFYRNKTKNILLSAKMVKEKYNGKIPDTMKEILSLPGVARKTANVVLGNAYGVVEGIAVDTHVMRLSILFGLTNFKDNPVKIEQDLMRIIPKKDWFIFTNLMISYGRMYCKARCKHTKCPLRTFYK